ncbi:unnamed protein product [Caenorhabditis brenneri]
MADNKIPLFRIPFLALCLILDYYSLNDIIQLSFCSKRSLRVANKCWKKKGMVKASLNTDKPPRIQLQISSLSPNTASFYTFPIYSTKDLRDRKVPNIRVGDVVVPSIHMLNKTITFWLDTIFGIEQTVRYIKDLFDVPISLIELRRQENPNEFIRIIDTIMSVQDSVKDCRFHHMNPMDDCLKHFLDNCKITGNLVIYGGPTRRFRHNWNIQLDRLHLFNGSSITLQNLMNIDCRALSLTSSSLTSEDANRFLQHWQNGGNSRLKFLSTEMKSINQEVITSGIDTVSQPKELHRYYERMSGRKVHKSGGIDIRRNDETTGTIFIYHNKFQFRVDPEVMRDDDE